MIDFFFVKKVWKIFGSFEIKLYICNVKKRHKLNSEKDRYFVAHLVEQNPVKIWVMGSIPVENKNAVLIFFEFI